MVLLLSIVVGVLCLLIIAYFSKAILNPNPKTSSKIPTPILNQTKERQSGEFTDKVQPSPTESVGSTQRYIGEGCKVGGCSSELCLNEDSEDIYSICIYSPTYECYKTARCEKQANGKCGWSQTEELKACLDGKDSNYFIED